MVHLSQGSSGQLNPLGGHRFLSCIQGTATRRANPTKEKKLLKCIFTLIRTSPAFGGATSTSSIESGLPGAQATAALHLITWKQPRRLHCMGTFAFSTQLGEVILQSPESEVFKLGDPQLHLKPSDVQ